ncbi:MAG: hypothetical protein QM655_12650 [Nocardioidaceae bacterium]
MANFRSHYSNAQLPLWWRCVLFALDHDGLPLQHRQLRDAVDPEGTVRASEISRAIHRAVKAHMLRPESTPTCLVVAREDTVSTPTPTQEAVR